MSSVPERRYTVGGYLALERSAGSRHEYFAERIYPLLTEPAEQGHRHASVLGNLRRELTRRLVRSGCILIAPDVRVKTPSGLYTYPDINVFCGMAETEDEHYDTLLNPRLLLEVISPLTEGYDHGTKFDHYRSIPTIQEYVLVDQDEPRIIHYVRQSDESWLLSWERNLTDTLVLTSVSCEIPLSKIYREIEFPADRSANSPRYHHAAPP